MSSRPGTVAAPVRATVSPAAPASACVPVRDVTTAPTFEPVGVGRRGMLLTMPLMAPALWQLASPLPAVAEINPPPRTDTPAGVEGRVFLLTQEDVDRLTLSERQVLLLNKRIQAQNRVALEFPNFIRAGFDVKVVAPGYSITPEGIIYKDFAPGSGDPPLEGQVSCSAS
eukprot:364246-Chlamydomonas_euryale.AAC.15